MAALLLVSALLPASGQSPAVVAYRGGVWWDGARFESRTAYVSSGTLSFRLPDRIDAAVDLAGGYVVPPFAEAHNHNVEGTGGAQALDRVIARYLAHGIFYVKNPNSLPRDRELLAQKVNRPTSIDVSVANGGWTGVGGHPMAIGARIARITQSDADGEGGFYWTAASSDDLARKWPAYLAQRPQFVKAYLLFSENHAQRRDVTAYDGWKGLDPSVLSELVHRAHAAKLRVSVHVETAADFHNALLAGADEVNHIPGFRGDQGRPMPDTGRFEIAETDAALAARNATVVVTTLQGAGQIPRDGPQREYRLQLETLARRNLQVLRRNGVRVAIGSDAYDLDALAEALFVNSLGVFEPAELLRMWTETTAKAIFPDRRIGVLEEGAEASFLVLRSNPLVTFSAVEQIVRRFKQGREILVP